MRCPICLTKTSDLNEHMVRRHPDQCDDSDFEERQLLRPPLPTLLPLSQMWMPLVQGQEEDMSTAQKTPVSTPKGKEPVSSTTSTGKSTKGKEPLSRGKKLNIAWTTPKGKVSVSAGKSKKEKEPVSTVTKSTEGTLMKDLQVQILDLQNQMAKMKRGKELCLRQRTSSARQRVSCPLCPTQILNLIRHLQQIHKYEKWKAQKYVKKNRDLIKGCKSQRKYRSCPMCKAKVLYLPKHLRAIHLYSAERARELSKEARFKARTGQMTSSSSEEEEDEAETDSEAESEEEEEHKEESSDEYLSELEKKADETGPGSTAESNPETEAISDDQEPTNGSAAVAGPSTTLKRKRVNKTESGPLLKAAKVKLCEKRHITKRPTILKKRSWREAHELRAYYNFLVDVKLLDKANAANYCAVVFDVWMFADKLGLFRIGSIVNLTILEKWFTHISKVTQPGTVASRLSIMKAFWWYLRIKKKIRLGAYRDLEMNIQMWNKRNRKKAKERKVQRMVNEGLVRITLEEIRLFKESDVKKDVEKILKKDEIMDPEDWNLVVGFLMLQLSLSNAQRCGAVKHLTMQVYANRTMSEGSAVCSHSKHKTGAQFISNLVFNKELLRLMDLYLVARARINNDALLEPTSPVFVLLSGKDIDHSHMNKILNRPWKRAGYKSKISFTKIRKATVTHMRTLHPEASTRLAQHMCHSVSTADSYYNLPATQAKALGVVDEIEHMTSGHEQVRSDVEGKEAEDTEHVTSDHDRVRSEAEEKATEAPDTSQEQEVSESDSQESASTSSHGRRQFSEEEIEVIFSICSDMAEGKTRITQSEVEKCLTEFESGRILLERLDGMFGRSKGLKKVADRLRTARRQRRE